MADKGSILFFGRLSDVAGRSEAPMPAFEGVVEVDELIELLAKGAPVLANVLRAPEIRVCVNLEILARGQSAFITSRDEVAFLPPMSGG